MSTDDAPASKGRFPPISYVWRVGFVLMVVVFIGLFIRFLIEDGGSTIFTVLMAWFFAMAMAPAVDRLSRRMRRGFATLIVMGGVVLFIVVFFAAFGRLLIDQLASAIGAIPALADDALRWINETFGTSYSYEEILKQIGLDQSTITSTAAQVAAGVLSLLGSILGGVFYLFTFGLIAFYLSADGPRLRRYVASLLPAKSQSVFLNVWDITAEKTGRYVAARVILATISGTASGIVFAIIGLPYWLPLAIWTGVVAQFVPTIGTYISIILPVIVGLLSGNPWLGVIVLVWALIYQQVENLTIEPKISAKAVDVHPAFGFVAVLLGAALFGAAGALLAIPVAAMILSLVGIYVKRHEVHDDDESAAPAEPEQTPAAADSG